MFQVSEWPWELNLPSGQLKNDIGEADKAIFEDVERSCELFFCILDIQKSDMYEVAEVMF
jgi:hypothetical protein